MKTIHTTVKSTLKSIDISRLFALRLNHGVAYNSDNWELFEPTKFIYSFFAFNMLYEVDWNETLKRTFIWEPRDKKYASDKIYLLLEFIYSNSNSKLFLEYYSKYDNSLKIVTNSDDIKMDKNIKRLDYSSFLTKQDSYVNNYKSAVSKLNTNKFDIEEHYKTIIFCYQIRNNVFHGLKKASEMIKNGQRERLLDYSRIILATIDMFYDKIESEYNYRLASEDELKENAGFIKY